MACRYCGKEMIFEHSGEKWLPVNPDGSIHDCRRKAVRRETWKRAHAPALQTGAELNGEFRRIARGA